MWSKWLIILALLLLLSACHDSNNNLAKNNPPPSQTPQASQADKTVKLYLIPFDIQFITGKHENEVEEFVKNNACQLMYSDFKALLDNDFSQTDNRMTYEKLNVRGKFLLDNQVYYIDYDGILNQPIDGFHHINKQKLTKLVATKCH